MRLLFITQKADKDDDILGVYHRWIEELSKRAEKISVICLYRGRAELPDNVKIFSLGKEKLVTKYKKSTNLRISFTQFLFSYIRRTFVFRIIYAFRFWKYLWQLRKDYDSVFVHMNPEYAILGGLFWKILGKKVFLWYNHPSGSIATSLAFKFADGIFYTSPFAFAAKFKKSEIMPTGIDTDFFKKYAGIQKETNSILYLGRISPIKNLEVLIEAAEILNRKGIDFRLSIVGSPARKGDAVYEKKIKKSAADLVSKDKIRFISKISGEAVPQIFNKSEICVNLTPSGSFDKTIIEAMACESIVLISNRSLKRILPDFSFFKEKNGGDLAEKLAFLLKMSGEEKGLYGRVFRDYAVKNHDLKILTDKLINIMQFNGR